MIGQRLAGTDGYGPPGFTLAALQTMLGERNYSAELARAAVVAMCRAHPVLTANDGSQVDVSAACSALASWNGRADAGAAATSCGGRPSAGINDTASWWRVPFDPAHPLTTPAGSTPATRSAACAGRRRTVLHGHHIPLASPSPAPSNTPGSRCPAAPRRRVLRPCRGSVAPGQRLDTAIDYGSSFIMAIELTPQARTPGPSSPTPNPRTLLAPLHRPDRPVRPQAVGHRAIHRSRDQRRPPPANHHPAQLTPIGLTPWPAHHATRCTGLTSQMTDHGAGSHQPYP